MLASGSGFASVKEVAVGFSRSRFCKTEPADGMQLHLQCRLQVVGCRVKSLQPLILELSREVAVKQGEGVVLADINSKPRMMGSGAVL